MRTYETKNAVELAELIAAYEEAYDVPSEQRITQWYGDYAIYELKHTATDEKVAEAKNKALAALGITEAEFLNSEFYKAHLRNYAGVIAQMSQRRKEKFVENPFADEKDFDDIRRRHQKELAEYKKECSLYIRKHLAVIFALTAKEYDEEQRSEIYERYEKVVAVALEEKVCLFAVDAFIEFLTERGLRDAAQRYKAKVDALRSGHWINMGADLGYRTLQCSVCHKETVVYDDCDEPTHCSCGARMKWEAE